MKALFLSVALTCALLPSAAPAQSVAGEWDAGMNTPGGARTFKLLFKVSGDTLSGTVKRQAGDVPLVGTVKGDTVRFSYTVAYNDNALTLSIVATVTGDSMKGTVDFGGAASDEFWAKRSAPPPGEEARRDARRRQ